MNREQIYLIIIFCIIAFLIGAGLAGQATALACVKTGIYFLKINGLSLGVNQERIEQALKNIDISQGDWIYNETSPYYVK